MAKLQLTVDLKQSDGSIKTEVHECEGEISFRYKEQKVSTTFLAALRRLLLISKGYPSKDEFRQTLDQLITGYDEPAELLFGFHMPQLHKMYRLQQGFKGVTIPDGYKWDAIVDRIISAGDRRLRRHGELVSDEFLYCFDILCSAYGLTATERREEMDILLRDGGRRKSMTIGMCRTLLDEKYAAALLVHPHELTCQQSWQAVVDYLHQRAVFVMENGLSRLDETYQLKEQL